MKKKSIVILIVVLAAAAAAVFLWMNKGLFAGEGGETEGAGVAVMKVADLSGGMSAGGNRYSGIVETQKKEGVKLDSDRTLLEVLVQEGDHVQAGDPLFSYDTQGTQLEIQQKEIELEKLDATIANYNDQIAELTKQMNAANVSAADKLNYSAQILEIQTSIAESEYEKKTKAAEIQKLKASVEDPVVKAPMTGTIETIADVENPDPESSAFITIVADGDFRVKGTVSEQNIMSVAEGAPVIVRSRIDPEKTWSGTITGIETKPESDEDSAAAYYSTMASDAGSAASKYVFYVELDTMDGLLLGQHVTIEQDPGENELKADGVYLPDGYIVFEEAPFVWAAEAPGKPLEKRRIELGALNEETYLYEITEGLSKEDYVAWPDESCTEGAKTVTSE